MYKTSSEVKSWYRSANTLELADFFLCEKANLGFFANNRFLLLSVKESTAFSFAAP
jgi:hypothetical protein